MSLSCEKITLTTPANGITMLAYKIIAFQGPIVTIGYFTPAQPFCLMQTINSLHLAYSAQLPKAPAIIDVPVKIDVKATQMFHAF